MWHQSESAQLFRLDGVESMRLEMTMSTKEDEDVFKNCIEEIIEEGFTLDTIRNTAQKVKLIIRIDENPSKRNWFV